MLFHIILWVYFCKITKQKQYTELTTIIGQPQLSFQIGFFHSAAAGVQFQKRVLIFGLFSGKQVIGETLARKIFFLRREKGNTKLHSKICA